MDYISAIIADCCYERYIKVKKYIPKMKLSRKLLHINRILNRFSKLDIQEVQ